MRLPLSYEGVEGWRIAYSPDLGYVEVDEEVQENTRKAVDVFRNLGCEGRGGRSRLDLGAC